MNKKTLIFIVLLALLSVLAAGCGMDKSPITMESEGVWNHYFVFPLSWMLIAVANLLNGSYGAAIILMTIFIRILLLPLFLKQQKSAKAMRDLKPEMERLKDKYDLKKEKEMQKYQREMLGLYQSNGINPAAGCLPIMVQLPILMAFYFAIMRTEEISSHSFLWMNLGQPDPFYIMPFLAGAAMFMQTKLGMNEMPANMKPAMYLMPVMLIGVGFALPSALSLYWFAGSLFMITQTYLVLKIK
ncbi:membrane protein insertase YidC [Thalassorhabdus alkalitolerans]|uniref:Membrane protein insertase YidC n=1 Tax=Thalassorhabdus alkalitolerans TaxID=2282697 RepID=A0ABW0YQ72_9BACI